MACNTHICGQPRNINQYVKGQRQCGCMTWGNYFVLWAHIRWSIDRHKKQNSADNIDHIFKFTFLNQNFYFDKVIQLQLLCMLNMSGNPNIVVSYTYDYYSSFMIIMTWYVSSKTWIWQVDSWFYSLPITREQIHGTNMGPTWVLSAPDEPHVGPVNLAILLSICCPWKSPRTVSAHIQKISCQARNLVDV